MNLSKGLPLTNYSAAYLGEKKADKGELRNLLAGCLGVVSRRVLLA